LPPFPDHVRGAVEKMDPFDTLAHLDLLFGEMKSSFRSSSMSDHGETLVGRKDLEAPTLPFAIFCDAVFVECALSFSTL
jgi:hypothetical protein